MNPNLGIINWSQNSINKYEKNAMNSARSANQLEKEVQKLNETFTSAKNNTNRYSSINGTRKVVNSRPFFQRMFTPRTKLYRNSASSRNAALAKKTRNNNYTRALKNRPLRNQKNTRKRANAAMANLSLKKFNAAMNMREKLKKGNIVRQQESNKRSKEVEEISKRSSAAIDQLNTAISNYAQRVKASKNKEGIPKRLEEGRERGDGREETLEKIAQMRSDLSELRGETSKMLAYINSPEFAATDKAKKEIIATLKNLEIKGKMKFNARTRQSATKEEYTNSPEYALFSRTRHNLKEKLQEVINNAWARFSKNKDDVHGLNTIVGNSINHSQDLNTSHDEEGSVPVVSTSQPISYGPNYQPFNGLNYEPATAELELRDLGIYGLDRDRIKLQQQMNQRREKAAAALRASNAAEFATM
jgi:hypothetical protein